MDQNFYLHEFPAVTTTKLRLVVFRTTHAAMINETEVKLAGWTANTPHLMLREIEIYGPNPEVAMAMSAETRVLADFPKEVRCAVKIANHRASPVAGAIRFQVPPDWQTEPANSTSVSSPARKRNMHFASSPPAKPSPPAVFASRNSS